MIPRHDLGLVCRPRPDCNECVTVCNIVEVFHCPEDIVWVVEIGDADFASPVLVGSLVGDVRIHIDFDHTVGIAFELQLLPTETAHIADSILVDADK